MQKTECSILAKAIAAIAVGMLAAPMAVAAQYDYQLITDGVTTPQQVFAINDPGQVAAAQWLYSTKEGTLTEVAPDADGRPASALGINDSGDITGSVAEVASGITITRGLIRSKHGEDTFFDHPGANNYTQGRGINNKGVVSGIYRDATFALRGFIYDPKSGEFTNIEPPLSRSTLAHGINSKGEVVGDALYFTGDTTPCGIASETQRYSWLRTKKGAMIYFQVNGQATLARGINDAGQVVGLVGSSGFVIDAPDTSCEAITVNASDLLAVPGAIRTFPEGITNSGDIVVIGFTATDSSGYLATPQVQ